MKKIGQFIYPWGNGHYTRMMRLNEVLPKYLNEEFDTHYFSKGEIYKKLASLLLVEITTKVLVRIATTCSTKRISLCLSPLIHPVDFVESLIKQAYNKNLVPYFPLSGLDDNVFESAKEIGLEKYLGRIKKLGSSRFYNSKQPAKKIEKTVEESITSKKTISVNVGQNNVHEILDEVRSNN